MTPHVPTYEDRLNASLDWALREGSMHFEEKSAVHQTLRKIARRLEQLKIPYAVVGGMALFLHGYRRFTEGVDILVTPEGLAAIHQKLEGTGYLPLFLIQQMPLFMHRGLLVSQRYYIGWLVHRMANLRLNMKYSS